MGTETTTKLMTADEFYEWVLRPEHRDRLFELHRGEVVEMSRPGERQGLVCSNANFILVQFVRQRRKGFVLANDPGLLLERDPDSVKGPDVVLFDFNRGYREMNPKWVENIPTLVVEVLSPSDRLGKTTRRVQEFLDAGIQLVWVIDPDGEDITVYRQGRKPSVLTKEDELTGEDVLPDFRCKVAEFFFSEEETPPPAES
jgi:Uma2 family endonuclease